MGGGRGRFQRVTAAGLGAAEIILGVAVALLTLQGFTARVSYYYLMQGLWCGAIFLISGCVSLAAGSSTTRSKISASLWLAVVASLMATVYVALTTYSLVGDATGSCAACAGSDYCSHWSSGENCLSSNLKNIALMINISALVLGIGELGIAVALAALCCDCSTSTPDSSEASTVSLHKDQSKEPVGQPVPRGEQMPYQIPLVIQMAPYQQSQRETEPKANAEPHIVSHKDQSPTVVLLPQPNKNKTESTRVNKVGPEPDRYVEVK